MADPSKNWHSIKFCCSILVRLSLFVLLLYREDQVEETIHQVAIIRQSLANTQYATYNIIIANSATTFLHNLNPLDLGNQRMLEVWQARPFDISFYITCPIFWNIISRQAGPPQLDPHIRQHREFMWAAIMHSIQKCWRPCKQVSLKKICRRVYSVRPTIPWSHLRLAPPASSCRRCPLYWGSLQVSF